jgi:aminoglycoside phosphotransferase family enzyme
VAFLRTPDAYPSNIDDVTVRETHMSWVFLAGERVYKLKKPLRTAFLDFSTFRAREAACRREVQLNRRLAKETYLDAVPLSCSADGLTIGGEERPIDWLVVMRRLDERFMLEEKILQQSLQKHDLDALAAVLARFYRHAERSKLSPDTQVTEWKRGLRYNRQVLLTAGLRLPGGVIRQIERLQEEFLLQCEELFVERSRARLIVDAHGDLRPEHIWLGEPLQIIDCLEFNQRLRTQDALSEIAFLDLECESLGAPWAGKYLQAHIFGKLPELRNDALFRFYRSYHAMVRARLAIAHLLEPHPRKPAKWRPLALSYLRLASADARKLQRFLKKPANPSTLRFHAACELSRR